MGKEKERGRRRKRGKRGNRMKRRRSGEEIKQRIIYGLYSGDTTALKPAVAIETRVK